MASKNLMQMSTNIVKLDRFDGGSFNRWQKKMQFLLATLKVAYVLTKPYTEESKNETLSISSSKMEISFVADISLMLCWICSSTYISTIPRLKNFGMLSRNVTSRKTQQYRLENKTNDDTSKVHVLEEMGESSKADGMKRRHDDNDKKKSKKIKKDVICYNSKNPGHFKQECPP
nr:wall-associated receptor kinase 2-like protein [Tanacetum cinerariifolium]